MDAVLCFPDGQLRIFNVCVVPKPGELVTILDETLTSRTYPLGGDPALHRFEVSHVEHVQVDTAQDLTVHVHLRDIGTP